LKQVSPGRDNNIDGNGRVRGVALATRDGVPEVRTAQRTLQPLKENFFGDDKPWSKLAVKADSTPKEIHSLAQRYLNGRCADKKDPKAYVAAILSRLATDPDSRFNVVMWMDFENNIEVYGVEKFTAHLDAQDANLPPTKVEGFHSHPCYDEWMEVLKPGKVGFSRFVDMANGDGSEKAREAFYEWARDSKMFTFSWD
jgi:hypothetical protein